MVEKDGRASPRYRSTPGAHIIYIEGTGGIRDLSLDGVFVLDTEPLPAGTAIKFSLRLGIHDVALQGIVRRSVEKVGMGIQFTDMTLEARRRLRLHISGLG